LKNYRSGKVGPGDILWNTLTVSTGYEANATGVPPYVNTSDPFTWYNHNKLFGKISLKKSSHSAYRYQSFDDIKYQRKCTNIFIIVHIKFTNLLHVCRITNQPKLQAGICMLFPKYHEKKIHDLHRACMIISLVLVQTS